MGRETARDSTPGSSGRPEFLHCRWPASPSLLGPRAAGLKWGSTLGVPPGSLHISQALGCLLTHHWEVSVLAPPTVIKSLWGAGWPWSSSGRTQVVEKAGRTTGTAGADHKASLGWACYSTRLGDDLDPGTNFVSGVCRDQTPCPGTCPAREGSPVCSRHFLLFFPIVSSPTHSVRSVFQGKLSGGNSPLFSPASQGSQMIVRDRALGFANLTAHSQANALKGRARLSSDTAWNSLLSSSSGR